jgi:hypothetical protein
MSATPNFASAGIVGNASIAATANTNQDGTTGTYQTIFTGTNGIPQQIDAISINATGTTTAGKIRFYMTTDGVANDKKKIGELNVSAATPSATVATFSDVWYPPRPIPVPDANTIIYAAPFNAEGFVAQCFGSKFT